MDCLLWPKSEWRVKNTNNVNLKIKRPYEWSQLLTGFGLVYSFRIINNKVFTHFCKTRLATQTHRQTSLELGLELAFVVCSRTPGSGTRWCPRAVPSVLAAALGPSAGVLLRSLASPAPVAPDQLDLYSSLKCFSPQLLERLNFWCFPSPNSSCAPLS